MKLIQKARLETFLKSKGFNIDSADSTLEEQKNKIFWSGPNEKVIVVPKKDILQSDEIAAILEDQNLLQEFRKF